MLTIQPKVFNNYGPTFKSSEKVDLSQISLADIDADTFEELTARLQGQQREFEEMADKKEQPKALKTAYKVAAGGAAAVAVGIGAGFGLRKVFDVTKAVKNSGIYKSLKGHVKDVKSFIVETAKTIKSKFVASDAYKKPAAVLNRTWTKFSENKFGKPIVNFMKKVNDGIKFVRTKVSDGYKFIKTKVVNFVKGVDKKKAEDVAINVVGASSGVAAGVNGIRENSESKEAQE